MENNPYASPALVAVTATPKPENPYYRELARLSWGLPLIGFMLEFALNIGAAFFSSYRLVAFLIFASCPLIGLVLAVVALSASLRFRGLRSHAIGGLIASSLLILVVITSFCAVSAAPDAARRRRVKQNLEQLQQGIDRIEHDKSAE